MPLEALPQVRLGSLSDAEAISALAIHVFLDTYATEGVSRGLASEVLSEYGYAAFAARLAEKSRRFFVAERPGGLVGFAEVLVVDRQSPMVGLIGSELVRLYVQPKAQRCGIGRALVRCAEAHVREADIAMIWLSAWDENHQALSFYARQGYEDVGFVPFVIQGQEVGNRVLSKGIASDV